MNLFGLVPPVYRWLALGLALIACFGTGWVKGSAHQRDADELAARRSQDAQERATARWVADLQARSYRLSADLERAKARRVVVTRTIVRHIPQVTTVYRETPDAPAVPIPQCVYTRGFVRVWNDALLSDDIDPATAREPDGTATDADTVRAAVGSADILGNHAENSGQYRDCRDALTRLQDWAKTVTHDPAKAPR